MKFSVYEKLTYYCRLSFYVKNNIINLICIYKMSYNVGFTFHVYISFSLYVYNSLNKNVYLNYDYVITHVNIFVYKARDWLSLSA